MGSVELAHCYFPLKASNVDVMLGSCKTGGATRTCSLLSVVFGFIAGVRIGVRSKTGIVPTKTGYRSSHITTDIIVPMALYLERKEK